MNSEEDSCAPGDAGVGEWAKEQKGDQEDAHVTMECTGYFKWFSQATL
jgi:hypothetical protein